MHHAKKYLDKKLSRLNKIILMLTLSDVFTWGPYIIISALAGIYLSKKLGQDAVEFIGVGFSIYYLTRGILQIPVGVLTDSIKSDRDEIILLIAGTLMMGFPFLFYPEISSPEEYYALQFIFGFGTALNITNWRKLFAKNLDTDMEGLEYGFYETIMSIAGATLTLVGGFIANQSDFYFDLVMRGSGILIMSASLWSIFIWIFKYRNRQRIK